MRLSPPLRVCQLEQLESRLMLSASGEPPDLPPGELFLPGSISGGVYAARHGAEVQRHADSGIPGVLLDLLDGSGLLVAQTTTDEQGRYEFSPLTPGSYSIREHQPAGMLDGQAWVGDGGGQLAAIDLIGDIWVTAAANLAGYDFAEIEIPAPDLDALSDFFARPALPFMAIGEAPAIERELALTFAEQPTPFDRTEIRAAEPVVAPAAAPVFGGGSRELERGQAAREIKRTVADPEGDRLVQGADDNLAAPVRISRLPVEADSTDNERAARDRAFDQDDESTRLLTPSDETPRRESAVKLLNYDE